VIEIVQLYFNCGKISIDIKDHTAKFIVTSKEKLKILSYLILKNKNKKNKNKKNKNKKNKNKKNKNKNILFFVLNCMHLFYFKK
jgi:hypothetical protein